MLEHTKERCSMLKDNEELQRWHEGCMVKFNPIPRVGKLHKLQNNISQRSPPYHEGLSPYSSLGIQQRGLGILSESDLEDKWGFGCRIFHETEETDTPLLEGVKYHLV